jgi:hypothetical protein
MGKTVTVSVSARDRYAVYLHLTKNVLCQTGREQDEHDDLWQSFKLQEIDDTVVSFGREAIPSDFPEEDMSDVELTKEEIGYFVKFFTRPMPGALVRMCLPIRKRLQEAGDKAGLKVVAAEGA